MLRRFSGSVSSQSRFVVPILQGEELWDCWLYCSDRQWQQLEIDLLKQLATQLAIAIQSTHFEQAQTELAEAEANGNYANKLPCCCHRRYFRSRSREQILFWNRR